MLAIINVIPPPTNSLGGAHVSRALLESLYRRRYELAVALRWNRYGTFRTDARAGRLNIVSRDWQFVDAPVHALYQHNRSWRPAYLLAGSIELITAIGLVLGLVLS